MGKYYMLRDGVRVGPLDPQEMLRQGLTRGTQVWREGMEGYAAASAVPELLALEGGLPPDAPTASTSQPTPGPGAHRGEPPARFVPGCSAEDFRFGLALPLVFILAGVAVSVWMADRVARGEMREQSMFLPWGFTLLALLVYHVNWFKLVYRGWKLLRSHSPRMGPAAGVAWAVVPIVNLYGRFYSVCGLVSDLNRVRTSTGRPADPHLLPLAIFTLALQTPLPFVKLATAGTRNETLFYVACLVLAPFELSFFYRLRACCAGTARLGEATEKSDVARRRWPVMGLVLAGLGVLVVAGVPLLLSAKAPARRSPPPQDFEDLAKEWMKERQAERAAQHPPVAPRRSFTPVRVLGLYSAPLGGACFLETSQTDLPERQQPQWRPVGAAWEVEGQPDWEPDRRRYFGIAFPKTGDEDRVPFLVSIPMEKREKVRVEVLRKHLDLLPEVAYLEAAPLISTLQGKSWWIWDRLPSEPGARLLNEELVRAGLAVPNEDELGYLADEGNVKRVREAGSQAKK